MDTMVLASSHISPCLPMAVKSYIMAQVMSHSAKPIFGNTSKHDTVALMRRQRVNIGLLLFEFWWNLSSCHCPTPRASPYTTSDTSFLENGVYLFELERVSLWEELPRIEKRSKSRRREKAYAVYLSNSSALLG